MELIAQHFAGGAQGAAKAVSLANEPRLAIGAAVAEFREMQCDQRQLAEPGCKLGDAAVVRPGYAERAVAARERIGLGEKALRRHDHRPALRHACIIGNVDIAIVDDAAAFNEWHRRAP